MRAITAPSEEKPQSDAVGRANHGGTCHRGPLIAVQASELYEALGLPLSELSFVLISSAYTHAQGHQRDESARHGDRHGKCSKFDILMWQLVEKRTVNLEVRLFLSVALKAIHPFGRVMRLVDAWRLHALRYVNRELYPPEIKSKNTKVPVYV